MNDNESRIRMAKGHPTIEPGTSIARAFNEARLPNIIRSLGPNLRRQIDTWVNEGGADEKRS